MINFKLNAIFSPEIVKLTSTFLFLVVFLSACGKKNGNSNSDDSKYYFTCTLNGVKKDFSHDAKFQGGGNDNKWEHITFGGAEAKRTDLNQLQNSFDIELWMVGGNITTGNQDFNSNGKFISRYSIVKDDKTILYNTVYDKPKDYVVKITELSKDGIKGTFSGTLKDYHNTETVKFYTVTDGAFYLPFDKHINSSF